MSVLTVPPVRGVVVTCGDNGAIRGAEVMGAPIAGAGAGAVVVAAGLLGSGVGVDRVDLDCAPAGNTAATSITAVRAANRP
jgi:hypothetical protein